MLFFDSVESFLLHYLCFYYSGDTVEKISRQKMPAHFFLMGCAVILALVASLAAYSIPSVYATPGSGHHTLPGQVAPVLKSYKLEQATNKGNQLQLSISLNLRNRDALTALIAAQNDPTSPSYHHYLTPQLFTAMFGPTQATVDSVVSYLKSQGLHVTSVASNNLLVDASGSVATAEQAFGVTLNNYVQGGRTVYAPTSAPTVPDTLGSAVLYIGGLDNITAYHHAAITSQARQTASTHPVYTPAELRTAYDVNSLASNGGTGAGQTTALFELDGYNPSDIATYRSQYNLGAANYSNVLVDGATNTPGSGSGAVEVELDMEVASALAPDATQKIYIGPNSVTGVNDTYNQIVTDDQAKVTSNSWSECESDSGDSELITLDNIFAQGAAQGQAFFSAAGDSGAYDCWYSPTTLAVGSPADDPNVVGVGGTTLNLAADGAYGSESVWGNVSGHEGGGGGISAYFTRPAYQTGTNLTNLNREVPDVSADADPATGYSIYCTLKDPICTNGWSSVGGTSGAAPLWAGIATDVNEYLANQGKATLGSASASLYSLYNTAQTYSAYHDITTGNNLYYSATPGYDTASGMGTPDAWNIARDLANATTGGNGGPTQLLKNGTFDSGSASWTESSSGEYEIVNATNPHAGGNSADLCGYATCNDSISQTVTLPAIAKKVVLSYWADVTTQQTANHCVDYLYAHLRTSRGAIIATPKTLCNTNAKGWTQYTFDVTSTLAKYAGKSIEVDFSGTNNATGTTDFFVDDVALNVTQS